MKVLVATDGSEHSMKAVQRALEMAEKQGAQVTLMSVAYLPRRLSRRHAAEHPGQAGRRGPGGVEEGQGRVRRQKPAGGDGADDRTGAGQFNHPKAQDGKFDRIVIGSTGQNALERIIMGSTASKVVAHAPCEVTVVR